MSFAIGFDPSLTGTAVCVMKPDGSHWMQRFSSLPASGVRGRVARFDRLSEDIRCFLSRTTSQSKPAIICIEGYTHGARKTGMYDSPEFGGIYRKMLCEFFGDAEIHKFYEVAASTLKKFVTGFGKGDKTPVIAKLTSQYGVIFDSDDEYDAYGLARVAMCVAGYATPTNQAQRDTVTLLTTPKVKRRK